ncbi:MAG: MmgE/PrpD family protein [Alphaproteobacteria bacterium]|nr:MmgE/PrpD family protein [Alphaproteobacteria bacterium]
MTTVAPLTRQLGEFTASLVGRGPLPASVLAVVRLGFTDTIGSMFTGIDEPVTAALRRVLEAEGGNGESRVCLSSRRMTASQAAFLTATAGHAIDLDDYAFNNHPSVVLVPTILALADAQGGDGARMAAAYAAGYESWAGVMLRESDSLHGKGWHPTAILGPLGATVAASVMLGLDATRCQHAIALAASCSGGVMANFGTMGKPLHAGRAAQIGVMNARLAAAGMEASADALESPRGLMVALSPRGNVDRATGFDALGREWAIDRYRLNIKKYPTVGVTQRTIDAVSKLRTSRTLDLEAIRAIDAVISVKQSALMPYRKPATALEAKFSLEFAVAATLLRGTVGVEELSDDFVRRADVQRLVALVRRDETNEADPTHAESAPADFVTLHLADGSRLQSEKIWRATGHADNPLDVEGVWRKFRDCAKAIRLPEPKARELFDRLQSIDRLGSSAEIPTLP